MDCIHSKYTKVIYDLRRRVVPIQKYTDTISRIAHVAYAALFLTGLLYAAYLYFSKQADFRCLSAKQMKVIYGLTIPNLSIFMPLAFFMPTPRPVELHQRAPKAS